MKVEGLQPSIEAKVLFFLHLVPALKAMEVTLLPPPWQKSFDPALLEKSKSHTYSALFAFIWLCTYFNQQPFIHAEASKSHAEQSPAHFSDLHILAYLLLARFSSLLFRWLLLWLELCPGVYTQDLDSVLRSSPTDSEKAFAPEPRGEMIPSVFCLPLTFSYFPLDSVSVLVTPFLRMRFLSAFLFRHLSNILFPPHLCFGIYRVVRQKGILLYSQGWVPPWHALLHDIINSLAGWILVLLLDDWRSGSPATRLEHLAPVHGNLFAWPEAGSREAQMDIIVSNSGSLLIEELGNWQAVRPSEEKLHSWCAFSVPCL